MPPALTTGSAIGKPNHKQNIPSTCRKTRLIDKQEDVGRGTFLTERFVEVESKICQQNEVLGNGQNQLVVRQLALEMKRKHYLVQSPKF